MPATRSGASVVLDVTAPLHAGLTTWPGVVERFQRREVAALHRGDAMTLSTLELSAHAGTHVDAPCHFVPGGGGVETIALEALIGPAHVARVPDHVDVIDAAVLDPLAVPPGTTRLLTRTRNSGWSGAGAGFRTDFVAFDLSGAEWCLAAGLQLVGIDYLSVEAFDADSLGYPVHRALLGSGVAVVESLDLAAAPPGDYRLTVLPLLIPGADGAPARAVLEPVTGSG